MRSLRAVGGAWVVCALASACTSAPDSGRQSDAAFDASDAGSETADSDASVDVASEDVPPMDAATDASSDGSSEGDVGGPDVADAADAAVEVDAVDSLACNGLLSNCGRALDEVLFAGTHNAMSARAEGFFAPNQEFGIARQLDDGIRALLIDAYRYRDAYYLCHGGCEIGATPAADALGDVAAFLSEHPREVILVIIENHISPADAAEMLVDAGLDAWAITPPDGAWPSLGELIDADTRILLTLESGAADVAWLPNAWSVFHDTPYSFSSTDAFTCDGNRGRAGEGLYLVNHWVQDPISYPQLAAEANARAELQERLDACSAVDTPNILAVDFYDVGDVVEVVEAFNRAL